MGKKKMQKDELGNRMKTFYEQIPRAKLMRRTPVIIRVDGRAFHTFTRGFQRPFDPVFIEAMQKTAKYLCENVQGCVLGYCQSDEISLVLIDYQRLESDAWFDYGIQKMCSIAASMATMTFHKNFYQCVQRLLAEKNGKSLGEKEEAYVGTMENAARQGAMFDARVFNLPKEEVTNYFYWRQLDASRNSVQMVGQANFSHRELQNKSCNDILDMLLMQKGIDWNHFPTDVRRGCCIVRNKGENHWVIDKEIPIFKGEGREYAERQILVG